MDLIKAKLKYGAKKSMSDLEFFATEIRAWKVSQSRKDQIDGQSYYEGRHAILDRQRTIIGKDGVLEEVLNLPNNLVVDNQYAKMVDQKANYLVGKPITYKSENKDYAMVLGQIFDDEFHLILNDLCFDSLNQGVAYVFMHYDKGLIKFKSLPAYEVLPFWKDGKHTELDCAVRVYEVSAYDSEKQVTIEKVEIYDDKGIHYYVLEKGELKADIERADEDYFSVQVGERAEGYNWERIPIIAFKGNKSEIPLISKVKSLQDGINAITSDFQNNMQEDARNSILVLVNYDGEDLGEFRHNLSTYGAVKVESRGEGVGGDVRSLSVAVNSENYKSILKIFKKALIENARGFDSKDDRTGNAPNSLNIMSMYSDIDLDADGMERQFKFSLSKMMWFIDHHFLNMKVGDFLGERVDFVFNRNVLINTSQLIDDICKSVGFVSDRTLLAMHPFVENLEDEVRDREKV